MHGVSWCGWGYLLSGLWYVSACSLLVHLQMLRARRRAIAGFKCSLLGRTGQTLVVMENPLFQTVQTVIDRCTKPVFITSNSCISCCLDSVVVNMKGFGFLEFNIVQVA